MLDADALLQLLRDHGHQPRRLEAPPGADWLVFDCGVLVRSAGSEVWRWSIIAISRSNVWVMT